MAYEAHIGDSSCSGTHTVRLWRYRGATTQGSTAPPTTSGGGTEETTTQGSTTPPTTAGGTISGFEGLSFVYASAADSIGIFKVVGDNLVTDAEALGIGMKRYDNDLDGEKALANAALMVQDNPDVAIDWNTFVGVGTAVGKVFTDAGIPCLAVNQQIPGCHWFNLSNAQIGIDAAEIVGTEAQARDGPAKIQQSSWSSRQLMAVKSTMALVTSTSTWRRCCQASSKLDQKTSKMESRPASAVMMGCRSTV